MSTKPTDTTNEGAGLTILADDLPPEHSAALLPGDAASEDGAKLILNHSEGFSVGSLARSLLAKFLGEHKEEYGKFAEAERRQKTLGSTFRGYETMYAKWRERMLNLEATIKSYQAVNIPEVLFSEHWKLEKSFQMIANDPEFKTCLLLKQHGDDFLKLVKAEYEAFTKQRSEFLRENRQELLKLGLIK